MRLNNKIYTCWININRACNLRCDWCYAQSTKFESKEMPFAEAKKVIDIFCDYGVSNFIILGGEPTVYNELPQLLDYIYTKNSTSTIVTNSIRLSDINYLNLLKKNHLQKVGISIKGPNSEIFYNNTHSKSFELVNTAISNLHNTQTNFSTSIVLTEDVLDNIEEWLIYTKNLGIKHIGFSFCKTPFNSEYKQVNAQNLIEKFVNKYEIINKLTKGNFSLHQTLPFCYWPKEMIDKMRNQHQLRSLCQLHYHSGIVVDTNLNLCVCNMLYDYPIGNLNNEIQNGEELKKYWQSEKTKHIYEKLLRFPQKECSMCSDVTYCAGGCIMQYLNIK